jgi:hypothetical protein
LGSIPAVIIWEANHILAFFEVQAVAHKSFVRVLSKVQDVEHAAAFNLAQPTAVTLDGMKNLAVVRTLSTMVTTLDHSTELAVVVLAPSTLPSKYSMEMSQSKQS